eukprot:COSAG01_NODE_667_length_14389_cov_5.828202_3_plen_46_part_00
MAQCSLTPVRLAALSHCESLMALGSALAFFQGNLVGQGLLKELLT